MPDQRQKVHRDVPKVDMQKLRVGFCEGPLRPGPISPGDNCQGALRRVRNQKRRRKCHGDFRTIVTGSNGKRAVSSRFCAITTGRNRRRAVICR